MASAANPNMADYNMDVYLSFTSEDGPAMFILTAGEDRPGLFQERFHLMPEIAGRYSPVLKAHFEHEQICRLQDTTDRAVFQLRYWIESQRLYLQQLRPDYDRAPVGAAQEVDEDNALVELWVLAGRLQIPKLQNHVIEMIDKIRMIYHTVMDISCFHYVYEKTEPGSMLRKFVATHVAWFGERDLFRAAEQESWPKEMLIDVLWVLKGLWDGEGRRVHISQFFVSEEGQIGYAPEDGEGLAYNNSWSESRADFEAAWAVGTVPIEMASVGLPNVPTEDNQEQ